MLFSFTPNKGNTAQQSIQLTLLTITLTSNVTQLRATPKTKELLKLQFPFPDGTFLFIVAYFENILCICLHHHKDILKCNIAVCDNFLSPKWYCK